MMKSYATKQNKEYFHWTKINPLNQKLAQSNLLKQIPESSYTALVGKIFNLSFKAQS